MKGNQNVELKPGVRLRSVVCDTEVIVMIVPKGDVVVSCGGQAMELIERGSSASVSGATSPIDPALASGTQLGKRYVSDQIDLELLATKAGKGTLTANGSILEIKDSKALPSSD